LTAIFDERKEGDQMGNGTGNRRALTCADCGFYDDIGRCSNSWAADCGELLEPDALACFDFVRKGAGEKKKEKLALAIRDMQGVAAQSGKQAGMLADIKRVTSDLADQTARGTEDLQRALCSMAEQLRMMAETVRATNERMGGIERTVATLEKVTPAQAAELNAAVRERAKEICADYLVDGEQKAVAKLIRKEVRMLTGSRGAKGIARCDFATVREMIETWDDVAAMARIRKGRTKKEAANDE
jgi:hypothetical protein